MVTVIINWKMVESSVEEGPNVPENAGKMVRPQYRLTLRCLRSAALTRTGKLLEHCHHQRHPLSAAPGLQRCRSCSDGSCASTACLVGHGKSSHFGRKYLYTPCFCVAARALDTHARAQFSFRHAPVSKGIFFASAAATFACFSSKFAADFVEVCTRHLSIRQPRLRAPHTRAAR